MYPYSKVAVLWHYSNGNNYAGAHRKICADIQAAHAWIAWMKENKPGFVLDEIQK